MFTGLVTDMGTIESISDAGGVRRFRVRARYDAAKIELGASIMHSGVCLTVVAHGAMEGGGCWFETQAVPETLSRTVLGHWREGERINLETSLRLGDELGGHFVFGHVDGVGEIVSVTQEGESWRVAIRPPSEIARFIAEQGSIAADGVSLTVAKVRPDNVFEIAVIPHTWAVTTIGLASPGRRVNLEIDMLARYVARILAAG